jgi:hypothetical protein
MTTEPANGGTMKSKVAIVLSFMALFVCVALAAGCSGGGGSTASGGAGSAATGKCDPNYEGACVPTGHGDVNCADVDETDIQVVGDDIYGLDGDDDGTACESPY